MNNLKVGMLIFDGFQLLDCFGPLEMFGFFGDKKAIIMIGEKGGSVRSTAGPVVVVDEILGNTSALDVLLIPGGIGTRREVDNGPFVKALRELSLVTPHVATICTGAALLARTGLLDGCKATTNKRSYNWVIGQRPEVHWVPSARWVEHEKFFTSSGVAAGIDMLLALISKIYDRDTALNLAIAAEYEWNKDPQHDPFSAINGLSAD